MSRIQKRFDILKNQGRKGLIPFFTAGDPSPEVTVDIMHALAMAGADVIELGMPFSDPMADGPVIQRASERALAKHVNTVQVLEFVRQFRKHDRVTPVVLMGYANPIERMGSTVFIKRAQTAGVDGVLVVDYLPEASEHFVRDLRFANMDPIFLLAPTSSDVRIEKIAKAASGYIYYVSLNGVTGAGHLNVAEVSAKLSVIRQHTSLPVGVGFGIRDAQSACAVASCADAVVIGSALIAALERQAPHDAPQVAESFLAPIRQALDQSFGS